MYNFLSGSDEPFLCCYCTVANFQKEIIDLRYQVKSLTTELIELQSTGTPPVNTQDNDNAIYSDSVSLDVATTFNEIQTQLKEITFSINSHQKLNLIT